ncbi:hypothetical protein CISIN_1g047935mg [Citrus sinensis]|uniref:Uncharacterized protein n=1 Tax=Citrus sinensis TaxID=2711 RepID=A0A067DEM3_CITSI|nr:hypothetical protein CISIN_1g047935mg [Citrus sinensis]
MMEYLRNVKGLLESFVEYTIIQISKEENSKANSLTGLALATDTSLNRLIPLEFLPRLSINEKESGKFPILIRSKKNYEQILSNFLEKLKRIPSAGKVKTNVKASFLV